MQKLFTCSYEGCTEEKMGKEGRGGMPRGWRSNPVVLCPEHASPQRVYRYGALPPDPVQPVMDEMYLAHKYRNALVALSKEEDKAIQDARRKRYPKIEDLETKLQELETAREAVYAEIKQDRKDTGKRLTGNPDQRSRLDLIRQQQKDYWSVLKGEKTASRQDEELRAEWTAISQDFKAKRKLARQESNLYSGNYMAADIAHAQSVKMAKQHGSLPAFRHFSAEGKVGIAAGTAIFTTDSIITNPYRNGLSSCDTTEDIKSSKTSLVRLELPPPRKEGQGKRSSSYAKVYLRITSDTTITIPIVYHRPLPPGVRIRQVYLVARKHANRTKYHVTFTVDEADTRPRGTTGYVAVNIGWRRLEDNLRVATWVDDQGESGELVLPMERVNNWSRVSSLQAIRDTLFNEALARLRTWLEGNQLPEWLSESTKTIGHWRGQRRLHNLYRQWSANRFPGDEPVFEIVPWHGQSKNRPSFADWWASHTRPALSAWRHQDRHLYQMQTGTRDHNLNWRDELYKVFAANLRKNYGAILLGDVKYKKIKEEKVTEESKAAAKQYIMVASPGTFRDYLVDNGAILLDAADLTRVCNVCGELNEWSQEKDVVHKCDCGAEWDQDYNHCLNLLARGKEACQLST